MNLQVLKITLLCAIVVIHTACTYKLTRFDELHRGIKSVALEPLVVDATIPLPYQEIWSELQRHIIIDQRLRLNPAHQSDSYIRITIKSAQLIAAGTTIYNDINQNQEEIREDPSLLGADAPNPLDYRNMGISNAYNQEQRAGVIVLIEVFRSKNHEKIFAKTYPAQTQYKVVSDIGQDDTVLTHLIGNQSHHFRYMANELANRILHDLLL